MSLSYTGANIRCNSFATDFPYFQVRNGSAVNGLTNRIAMTDGTRVSIGSPTNGVIIITVTIPYIDFTSLPFTVHDLQLFAASTGGTACGTFVATADKTVYTDVTLTQTWVLTIT